MITAFIYIIRVALRMIIPAMLLAGCSTATLTVNSVPEKAKVFVRPVGGGEGVQVGTTPVVLNRDQLKAADSASGPIIVEVQKDDFQPERVLVTEAAAVDMKLNFAMQLKDPDQGTKGPGNSLDDAQSLNTAIDRLFEVRKFISLESYNEALNHLRYIENTWPYLSATYEMKAGIFFLQRKYKDALAAYALALKYNPQSVASLEMVENLEKQLNLKSEDLVREYEFKRTPASLKRKNETSANEKSEGTTTKAKTKRRVAPRKKTPDAGTGE